MRQRVLRRIAPLIGALLVAAPLVLLMGGRARADVIHVNIQQLAYMPAQISAYVGDTVEWDNKDIVVHTATARDKSWDVVIAPNGKNSIVLKAAGTVPYYCRFHPNMIGQITVKARQ